MRHHALAQWTISIAEAVCDSLTPSTDPWPARGVRTTGTRLLGLTQTDTHTHTHTHVHNVVELCTDED